MSTGFMKGALVQFMDTMLIPLPNVIIFQFNPETITHTLTPAAAPSPPPGKSRAGGANPLIVSGDPGQSFSFTIQLDAQDEIEMGGAVGAGIAQATGIYSRLAALETLMYPVAQAGGSLLASLSISVSVGGSSFGGSASGGAQTAARVQQVPTVLFIFGPGRIWPVKVTGLTVTEKLYDGLLNPTYAEAQLQLRVLTPDELDKVNGPLGDVAKGAYKFMGVARQALAVANLANAAESIIGMLPL